MDYMTKFLKNESKKGKQHGINKSWIVLGIYNTVYIWNHRIHHKTQSNSKKKKNHWTLNFSDNQLSKLKAVKNHFKTTLQLKKQN